MFSLINLLLGKRGSKYKGAKTTGSTQNTDSDSISKQLATNVKHIQQVFNLTPDLVIRHIQTDQAVDYAALVYLGDMADKESINNNIQLINEIDNKPQSVSHVSMGDIRTASDWNKIEDAILQGDCVLFQDGQTSAHIYDTKGWPQRAVEDSQIEKSIRGAHQGFVETASKNIAMIRRYIPNKQLKIKEIVVGERGKSKVSIMYLADVAHPEVLKELEDRINQVDVDAIINSGELAEFIEDNPY